MNNLFIFGYGYTANYLIKIIESDFNNIFVTSREPSKISDNLTAQTVNFSESSKILNNSENNITHVLCSIPPDIDGDPAFLKFHEDLKNLSSLRWIGYLSATSVYGDHNGELVDENSELKANNQRGLNRILAEEQWLKFCDENNILLNIFRIAGIYGPGRNIFERIKNNEYKLVIKPNHFFSRIYITDLIHFIREVMLRCDYTEIYNVSDDLPSNIQDIVKYICHKIEIEQPDIISFEKLQNEMTKSFYKDNKKVNNKLIKNRFNLNLKFPTYREGYDEIIGK